MKDPRRLPPTLFLLVLLPLVALAASAWVLSQVADRRAPARRAPNVILISIDTLRPDHLGCYGYRSPTSPAIDRFRRDAVLFREAIAHAPSTLPSHASIFTSLLPQHHGVGFSQSRPVPRSAVTLAEALRDYGYVTRAVVSGGQLASEFGLGQGFDSYQEVSSEAPFREVVGRGLELAGDAGRPFFLFLHTYEVHHPYTPEKWRLDRFDPGYAGVLPDDISVQLLSKISRTWKSIRLEDFRHIVAAYDAEISSVDEAFGELIAGLEARGLYRDALLVFTSDHGEEFNEHGKMGWHSHTLYDELLRVPLLVKLPGLRHAGGEVAGAVRGIDIAPTVLAVAGVPAPAQFAGRSLLPYLRREGLPSLPAVVWRETLPQEEGTFSGIRTSGWKLHRNRLYDLREDPAELYDLTAERPEVRRRLERELEAQLALRRPLGTDGVEVDEETRRSLRTLGYAR